MFSLFFLPAQLPAQLRCSSASPPFRTAAPVFTPKILSIRGKANCALRSRRQEKEKQMLPRVCFRKCLGCAASLVEK
jgi:hypothetical protein